MNEQPRHAGFTLMETLVVLAVIAVVVTLVIPGIANARRMAKESLSLARLRQHSAVFSTYTSDHRDQWPWLTRPGFWNVIIHPGMHRLEKLAYFAASDHWPGPLTQHGYYAEGSARAFASPDVLNHDAHARSGGALLSDYVYDCSFLADPGFWDPQTRTGPAQWRSTRLSEVTYPSSKVLLSGRLPWAYKVDPHAPRTYRAQPKVDIALVDGAAFRVLETKINASTVQGDGMQWHVLGSIHSASTPPGTHTPGGTRGRDLH